MIDEKKLLKELRDWKSRLSDSCQEDFVSVILDAVISRVENQPKLEEQATCVKEIPDKAVDFWLDRFTKTV